MPLSSHRRLTALLLTTALIATFGGCSDDGPEAFRASPPITVDVQADAMAHNGGELFEFVVDGNGYVSVPNEMPAGPITLTLTYVGDAPAPHSLVIDGLNGDQPVVAVDLPGSNSGSVVLPEGDLVFFDGAPGNRARGYEGRVHVAGPGRPSSGDEPQATLSWATQGVAFVDAPQGPVPADVPVALQLTVPDALPHSIAFERAWNEQPLVAVDGPGTNQRTITLPPGTYVYFCAVPGHREAGMEGRVIIG